MKRFIGWALIGFGVAYALFCVVLLFVGCLTTAHVFPHDHGGNKVIAFSLFSLLAMTALFGAGSLVLEAAE